MGEGQRTESKEKERRNQAHSMKFFTRLLIGESLGIHNF